MNEQPLNDHDLRDAYDAALRATERDVPKVPIPVERIEGLVARDGSEAERLRTLDVLMSTADGRRELEVAWAAKRAAPPAPVKRWNVQIYAAAAVLLVSVSTVTLWRVQNNASVTSLGESRGRSATTKVSPSAGTASLPNAPSSASTANSTPGTSPSVRTRSRADNVPDTPRGDASPLTLVAPRGSSSAQHARTFVWHRLHAAQKYVLVVVDSAGNEVFALTTRDSSVTLPDTVQLRSGAQYLWWVQADVGDGATVSAVTEKLRIRD